MLPIFERLESEKIKSVIESDNLYALTRLDIFNSIGSTNTFLLSEAKLGASSGSVCFAEEQTAGRGRRGRQWYCAPGSNIACSLLWKFPADDTLRGLSIAVAVMVANGLKKYGIMHGIQLKWPNDILFSGRKLAGILLERSGENVVIGIGLNLFLPEDADPQWIAIQEISPRNVQRNYLAGLLVNELLSNLKVYQRRGLGVFMQDWQSQDFFFGQTVNVFTPEKTICGIMRGINEYGEMLLEDEVGHLQTFCYGEVSVRAIS